MELLRLLHFVKNLNLTVYSLNGYGHVSFPIIRVLLFMWGNKAAAPLLGKLGPGFEKVLPCSLCHFTNMRSSAKILSNVICHLLWVNLWLLAVKKTQNKPWVLRNGCVGELGRLFTSPNNINIDHTTTYSFDLKAKKRLLHATNLCENYGRKTWYSTLETQLFL